MASPKVCRPLNRCAQKGKHMTVAGRGDSGQRARRGGRARRGVITSRLEESSGGRSDDIRHKKLRIGGEARVPHRKSRKDGRGKCKWFHTPQVEKPETARLAKGDRK